MQVAVLTLSLHFLITVFFQYCLAYVANVSNYIFAFHSLLNFENNQPLNEVFPSIVQTTLKRSFNFIFLNCFRNFHCYMTFHSLSFLFSKRFPLWFKCVTIWYQPKYGSFCTFTFFISPRNLNFYNSLHISSSDFTYIHKPLKSRLFAELPGKLPWNDSRIFFIYVRNVFYNGEYTQGVSASTSFINFQIVKPCLGIWYLGIRSEIVFSIFSSSLHSLFQIFI